jgi:hypothetical protein
MGIIIGFAVLFLALLIIVVMVANYRFASFFEVKTDAENPVWFSPKP